MSTITTAPTQQQHSFHSRSNIRATLTALLAILGRDLLIIRREILIFLLQTLVQPLFFLFVMGKVFSAIGATSTGFSMILLPGIVALTVFLTGLQSITMDLGRDLNVSREIDDRLLAPLPVTLVVLEKVLLAMLRSLIAGAFVFPLAYWILGSGYQVSTDQLGILIGLMVLIALVGSALGLVLSTTVPIQLFALVFGLVLTPLMFTGCTFYPWASLSTIKWFQIVTLFNPLTYAAEGMRYAMLLPVQGQAIQTLAIGWVLLVLGVVSIVSLWGGVRFFHRRVVG